MTAENLEDQLRQIFSVVLDVPSEEILPELSPDTCSTWDSLHHIHLISAIDETFAIQLSVEQQIEMMTFDLTIDVVREALLSDT